MRAVVSAAELVADGSSLRTIQPSDRRLFAPSRRATELMRRRETSRIARGRSAVIIRMGLVGSDYLTSPQAPHLSGCRSVRSIRLARLHRHREMTPRASSPKALALIRPVFESLALLSAQDSLDASRPPKPLQDL